MLVSIKSAILFSNSFGFCLADLVETLCKHTTFFYICILNPFINLNNFVTVLEWFWIRGYSDISVI